MNLLERRKLMVSKMKPLSLYGADATVTFDINSSWNAVELFSSGRTDTTLKIYKIWLEG